MLNLNRSMEPNYFVVDCLRLLRPQEGIALEYKLAAPLVVSPVVPVSVHWPDDHTVVQEWRGKQPSLSPQWLRYVKRTDLPTGAIIEWISPEVD